MSDNVYDDWPMAQPLEVRVRPKWPASFILKWLAAGVAYGLVLGLLVLGVGAAVTSALGGALWPGWFIPAGWLFLLAVWVPLTSEMSYRESNIEKRWKAVRRED